MSLEQVKDLLECAIKHDCGKENALRCAQCELGLRLIAEDSLQLSCSHIICGKCKPDLEQATVECKFHGEATVGCQPQWIDVLLTANLQALFQDTRIQFEKAASLHEGKS